MRVSEPVLSRTAQLYFENGEFDSYASAELNLRHKLLPITDFIDFLEYEMWDIHLDSSKVKTLPIICIHDSKLSPVTDREMLDIELEVAKLYISSLGTSKQFALSSDYFVPEHMKNVPNRVASLHLYLWSRFAPLVEPLRSLIH